MRLIDAAFTVYAAESEFDEEDASKIRWLISHIPSVDAVHVVHCEACTHMREENGVLRCPYSTVDLDPNGYCSRGIKMWMTTKKPMDENTKKVISEGEWGDKA